MVSLVGFAAIAAAVQRVDGDDIHALAASGEVEKIVQLIEFNPSLLNKQGIQQRTPLMHAVLSGQTAVVKALLDLGADTNTPEKVGLPAL